MTLSIIYEPSGPALEYAPLACNLFKGCIFGCKYCYGPRNMRVSAEQYHSGHQLKKNALERLRQDAEKLAGDPREILFSFIGDVCQNEVTIAITQQALEIVGRNNLKATILTKGGMKAEPLFPVLKKYGFSLGTSLVFYNDDDRKKWEPNSADIFNRLYSVVIARNSFGIKTWWSAEPVIYPDQVLRLIDKYHRLFDHIKIGKINHNPELEKAVDWYKFYADVTNLLDSLGASYYIKESLRKYEVKP